MKILGIETSFDETAAAVVQDGTKIITNVIASSAEIQQKYGGTVPEIAARKRMTKAARKLQERLGDFYGNE